MWRRLLRLISCWLVAIVMGLPVSTAQAPGQQPTQQVGEKVPALAYAIAALSALLVLVIVCTPSRKRA